MGGEHFGFLIEAGRDGFPDFDDDPRLWVRVIDEIIGRKFACGHDREELVDRYYKLTELLDERAKALGLDEETDDYEEKRDELLQGTWVLQALQEGFNLRPLPADPAANSGVFSLEIQEEEKGGTEHPRLLEKVCCFVPPFIAGIDRIMDKPVFSDCLAHDIRMDPVRPLDRRSAIMFLNVRW